MFTGIVEEIGKVIYAPAGRMVIAARDILQDMKLGGSISVNGVCLTVTDFNDNSFSVDTMPETLQRTNLGLLHAGTSVNLERPLSMGGQLGGHLVQGHIDDTGRIATITPDGESLLIRLEASPEVIRYTVPKGFIAIDGISLTIVDKDSSSFWVSVVSFTRNHTTLGSRQVRDVVNLEIDIIAKYVEQFTHSHSTGITEEFLREHGFVAN